MSTFYFAPLAAEKFKFRIRQNAGSGPYGFAADTAFHRMVAHVQDIGPVEVR